MSTKHLLASKLFWLGFLEVAVGVSDLIKTNVLDSEAAAWGAVLTGIATVILRVVTKQAVWVTTTPPPAAAPK
jgi:hypothetical protein